MVRFLSGFILGLGCGFAMAIFFGQESGEAARENLRMQTASLAAGDDTLVGSVQSEIENQRRRFDEAIEVGRRVSAKRQNDLWAQLKLTPPESQRPNDSLGNNNPSLLT